MSRLDPVQVTPSPRQPVRRAPGHAWLACLVTLLATAGGVAAAANDNPVAAEAPAAPAASPPAVPVAPVSAAPAAVTRLPAAPGVPRDSPTAVVAPAAPAETAATAVPANPVAAGPDAAAADPVSQTVTAVEAADVPSRPADCPTLLQQAQDQQAAVQLASQQKRWDTAKAALTALAQTLDAARAQCTEADRPALFALLDGQTRLQFEVRDRIERFTQCRPALDQALGLDGRAEAARGGKLAISEVERLYADAEAHWRTATTTCHGKDLARAQAGLADTTTAHAAVRVLSDAGSECDDAWRAAEGMVELGKGAWKERRWEDAAMLYRKAALAWDVAGERCEAGERHQQAAQKQDSAAADAHNAAWCAPDWDKARELSQRLKVEGQVLPAKERADLSMRAEVLWRSEMQGCVGPDHDRAKANAEAIAKDRGTPLTLPVAVRAVPAFVPNANAIALADGTGVPTSAPVPAVSARPVNSTPVAANPVKGGGKMAVAVPGPMSAPPVAAVAAAALPIPAAAPPKVASREPAAPGAAAARPPSVDAPVSTPVPVPAPVAGTQPVAPPAADVDPTSLAGVPGIVLLGPNRFTLAGDLFEGDFRVDPATRTLTGRGTFTRQNGDVYTGAIVRGRMEGAGTFRWKNGLVADGTWADDHLVGRADLRFPNGNHYLGDTRNAVPDGKGTMTFASGDRYEGDFEAGLIRGQGRYTWANGDVFEGSLVNAQPEGKGKTVFASGDSYEGDYHAGLMEGQGRYRWPNGDVYEGGWKAAQRDGPGTYIWANGEKSAGVYAAGKQVAAP